MTSGVDGSIVALKVSVPSYKLSLVISIVKYFLVSNRLKLTEYVPGV